MQLKASTDYGIRAILYLAAQGTTCSSKDIAHDMSIPRDYLIQLAQLLRNAGLIEARPGKHGGYRLAKDPADISVLQIISALDEDAKQSTRQADQPQEQRHGQWREADVSAHRGKLRRLLGQPHGRSAARLHSGHR